MEDIIMDIVTEYQCPGCVCGGNSCYKPCNNSYGCKNHVAGTMASGIGLFFLGMPKGFNRLGLLDDYGKNQAMQIHIFENISEAWINDKFNIAVWKYFDGKNTIVRGLQPRLNIPFLFIILGDCRDKIDCLEITAQDIEFMD